MKIAISSEGNTENSNVCFRFGRSPHFIIFDTEAKTYEHIDNSEALGFQRGVGMQTTQKIVNSGAELVLTGDIGPKAAMVLSSSNVVFVNGIAGKVSDVVEKYVEDHNL